MKPVDQEHPSARERPSRRHRLLTPTIVAGAVIGLGLSGAPAFPFAVSRWTVDAGGGTSSGGRFRVSGTIGQPDAGAVEGGRFTVRSGFWHGVRLTATPGLPRLDIRRDGDTVIVFWKPNDAGGIPVVLEESADLEASGWRRSTRPITLEGDEARIVIPSPTGTLHFRLIRE